MKAILSYGRGNDGTIFAAADEARDKGDRIGAINLYGRIGRTNPLYRAALVQRGNLLKDLSRFAEAERSYQTAWTLDGTDSDVAMQLGHLHKLAGRLDDAVAWYVQAQRLGSAHAAAEIKAFRRMFQDPHAIFDVAQAVDPARSATTMARAVRPAIKRNLLDVDFYRDRYGSNKTIPEIHDEFLRSSACNGRSYSNRIDGIDFLMTHRGAIGDRVAPALHVLRQDAPSECEPRSAFANFTTVSDAFPEGPRALPVVAPARRIAIHLHLYYEDYIPRFRRLLSRFPARFELLISKAPQISDEALEPLRSLPNLARLIAKPAQNRGRNFGPMLVDFRKEIAAVDLCCHLHSKKSLFSGAEQRGWASYQLDHLVGDPHLVEDHLRVFASDPAIALLAPVPYWGMPFWASHWLRNESSGAALLDRLGLPFTGGFLPYAMGGMFWFRPSRLARILDIDWHYDDFPAEAGQTDGTIQHALERAIAVVARKDGRAVFYEPWTGRYGLNGYDVLSEYRLRRSDDILDAGPGERTTSFDVFDTLLYRRSLDKEIGKRAVAAALRKSGREELASRFVDARNRTELDLRRTLRFTGDVSLVEIYRAMAARGLIAATEALPFSELEAEADLRDQAPRLAVIDIVNTLIDRGDRVVFVSDTYYSAAQVRRMIVQAGVKRVGDVFVSSELRRRKDMGTIWPEMMSRLNIAPRDFKHVGDNVVSDAQLVGDARLPHRLVLGLLDKASDMLGLDLHDPAVLAQAERDGLKPVIIAIGKNPFFS